MPKNYYVILGIPANASLDDIKNAYRRLAKEFHPDYYGNERSPFLAIQEAYRVLSDPFQRQKYDENLNIVRFHAAQHYSPKTPRRIDEEDVEPMVPEAGGGSPRPVRSPHALCSVAPDMQSFLDQFFNRASENWDYGTESAQNLKARVRLNRSQVRCPDCRGWGSSTFHECRRCFDAGYLRGEIPLLLNYPAGTEHNHTVTFSLQRYGLSGKMLTVIFVIE
ncbi:MAG: J domain-containing protein [Desulfopila sp.]